MVDSLLILRVLKMLFCLTILIVFLRFPKNDPDMLRIWVDATSNAKLKEIDVLKLYNNYVICERHFERNYVVPCSRSGLKKSAVPTLYLPEPSNIQKYVKQQFLKFCTTSGMFLIS